MSFDPGATLRAAAVGVGVWALLCAAVCRWFWAMKQLGGSDGE